ncbi:MAG: DUF4358 domain-containing protein, partial [Oscillospiraceae bacterium]|nr:DUF4358 domain-containing protein [Oscillospiraceae bacterium]
LKEQAIDDILAEFGSAPTKKAAKQAVPAQKQPASPAPSAPLVIDGVDFSEFLDNAPASRKTAAAPIPDPQPIREPVKTPDANKPPAPEKSAVTEDVPAPDTAAAQPAACRVGIVSILLRIFAFAAALATAGFLYTQTMQNRQSSASFDAVSSAVLQSIDLTDMQEADAQMVRRLYGFAPSEMDGCLLYYPATNMGARELLLVKLSDLSQQTSVSDAIQARRQTQMKSFEGYGVEQYDLLSNSVVEIQGNYILFVVHENAAAAAQAFLKAL